MAQEGKRGGRAMEEEALWMLCDESTDQAHGERKRRGAWGMAGACTHCGMNRTVWSENSQNDLHPARGDHGHASRLWVASTKDVLHEHEVSMYPVCGCITRVWFNRQPERRTGISGIRLGMCGRVGACGCVWSMCGAECQSVRVGDDSLWCSDTCRAACRGRADRAVGWGRVVRRIRVSSARERMWHLRASSRASLPWGLTVRASHIGGACVTA